MKFEIDIPSKMPEGVTPIAYRTAVPGESILRWNGTVEKVNTNTITPKLIVEVAKWRDPILPEDAGEECQFRSSTGSQWVSKILTGYQSEDILPWRSERNCHWRYARIEDKGNPSC